MECTFHLILFNSFILGETNNERKKIKSKKKKERLKENIMGYSFLAPALILLFIFLVIPVGMVIYYAFTDYYLLTPEDRKFVGLQNFSCA